MIPAWLEYDVWSLVLGVGAGLACGFLNTAASSVGDATLHLRTREILVARIDRFELAPINGDARVRQQAKLSAKRDEPRTHLADRRTVVLAEIGNCLVIGNQPAREPHHLYVARSLTAGPPAVPETDRLPY